MGFTGGPWTARPTLTKGNDIGKNQQKSTCKKYSKWGIRIFFLHCKNGRALVLPVEMRRKGEDGLGQFGPALFACKAPYQSTI